MNSLDVLQIALNPILNTVIFWNIAAWIMVLICVISKTLDTLKRDWKQIQLRHHYQIIASTHCQDLRRLTLEYNLKPTSQRQIDLIAAIYNFQQSKLAAQKKHQVLVKKNGGNHAELYR